MKGNSQNRQRQKKEHQLVKQISFCKIPPRPLGTAACQNCQVDPADNGDIHTHQCNKPMAYRNRGRGGIWRNRLLFIPGFGILCFFGNIVNKGIGDGFLFGGRGLAAKTVKAFGRGSWRQFRTAGRNHTGFNMMLVFK